MEIGKINNFPNPKNRSIFYVRKSVLLALICVISFSLGFVLCDFIRIQLGNISADSLEKISNIQPAAIEMARTVAPIEKYETLKTLEDIKSDFISQKIPAFIEVNFPDAKVRFWENGELKKEVNVAATGGIQDWGGTPAGLYSILSKDGSAFSGIAGVYMPYSIRFYGKYYIHGLPYYPGGNKLVAPYTGGCVQLSDNDAKTIYDVSQKDMPVLVIDNYKDKYNRYANNKNISFPDILAESYLVADLDSGTILAQKNLNEKYPIASLTKLMTAVVASENIDLKKNILVTNKVLKFYNPAEGLVPGREFNILALFYPMLMDQSDGAPQILSSYFGNEKTVQLMNEKAKSLMMENTIFNDAAGIDPGNMSAVADLFYLSRYILNNRSQILEITKGEKVDMYGQLNFDINKLANKNLFYSNENFIGGITGNTNANYNGSFLINFSGNGVSRRIAIIILNDKDQTLTGDGFKMDTQKIIDWVNLNYFQ